MSETAIWTHEPVDLRLLGPIACRVDDAPIDLPPGRARAVLALLALRCDQVVRPEQIIDEIWGPKAPPSASANLYSHVSRLRHAFGTNGRYILRNHRSLGYALHTSRSAIDVTRFQDLVRNGQQAVSTDPETSISLLTRALELWRGDPLIDFRGYAFAKEAGRQLEAVRLLALQCRVEARLHAGQHSEAVGELQALLTTQPINERLWDQLISTLVRAGRHDEAGRCYQEYVSQVRRAGLAPSQSMRELERLTLAGRRTPIDDPSPQYSHWIVDRSSSDRNRSTSSGAAELVPRPITHFVGRDQELEQLRRLVDNRRLVTIVGLAGIGKTRIALELAHQRHSTHLDEVRFVQLISARPEAVRHTIDASIGVERSRRDKKVLLILDNCEVVRPDVAAAVQELLERHSAINVLATSRQPLDVAGEAVFRLESLPTEPPGTSAAFELFVSRASSLIPGATFGDTADVSIIHDICRRLGGLPLAIELAATCMSALTLADLQQQLDQPFDLLAHGQNRLDTRHRSLQSALESSFETLSEEESRVLDHVASQHRPSSLRAIQNEFHSMLEAQVTQILMSLVSKSLVISETSQDVSRFSCHEVVRMYVDRYHPSCAA